VGSREEQDILESFVEESREMVRAVLPSVQALARGIGGEDQAEQAIAGAFRLFHSVRGTGAFLRLDHLAGPAEAMEHLLHQVRSGRLTLTPPRLALLTEACTFMDQGLLLVLAEKNDLRLAATAGTLSAAIMESAQSGEVQDGDGAGRCVSTADNERLVRECGQLLATVEQEFVLWDFIAVDYERVADLCRLLHRLKQQSARCGLEAFARLCMGLESTVNRFLQGEFFQTEYPERIFLRCVDAMREALTDGASARERDKAGFDHHLAAIQGLIRQPIGELLIEAGLIDANAVDAALATQRAFRVEQPRRLGEVLVAMGEVTEAQVEDVLQAQHSAQVRAAEAEAALARNGPAAAVFLSEQGMCQEVSVDGRKLARLIALVKQMASVAQPEQLQLLVAEAQSSALACEQEAFSSFLLSLQRFVHGLAERQKKRVQFSIQGAEILQQSADVTILCELLVPLLRNSVTHGLESVDERVRLGKRKSGKLSLTVHRQGNEILVSVEDDGRGFDPPGLAAAGVAPTRDAAVRDSQAVGGFLPVGPDSRFRPSETNADPAADNGLSGVSARLKSLRGAMELYSNPGKGARITLRVAWGC
jgi:two-component system chemotaxis sensor kinase CheA